MEQTINSCCPTCQERARQASIVRITRQRNRKFYLVGQKRYTNLYEIATAFVQGKQLQIKDWRTQQDLLDEVLRKIFRFFVLPKMSVEEIRRGIATTVIEEKTNPYSRKALSDAIKLRKATFISAPMSCV